jgi:hypothetical protein
VSVYGVALQPGGLNNYGELKGYEDHEAPYDRCNRNGCGY